VRGSDEVGTLRDLARTVRRKEEHAFDPVEHGSEIFRAVKIANNHVEPEPTQFSHTMSAAGQRPGRQVPGGDELHELAPDLARGTGQEDHAATASSPKAFKAAENSGISPGKAK